jgi:hypothetical protein
MAALTTVATAYNIGALNKAASQLRPAKFTGCGWASSANGVKRKEVFTQLQMSKENLSPFIGQFLKI